MNDETISNLTDQTEKLISAVFSERQRAKIIDILRKECGNNLPFCDNLSPTQLERIRFAAIKTSEGSLEKLMVSVNLAKTDWRDLLIQAGFADDLSIHEKWAAAVIK